MARLQKINEQVNVITGFEIPVTDIERAIRFYESILDIKLVRRKDGEEEAAFFPYNPNIIQASSGRVTGVLSQSSVNQPSSNGTIVYINASPRIQEVIDRVERCGGKVIMPKTEIPAGFISIIHDSEGNKVGLYAEE